MKKIIFQQPTIGMDVELFLESSDGEIIGAEKVLGGSKGEYCAGGRDGNSSSKSKLIVDGVQAELNPMPSYCREVLYREICHLMSQIDKDVFKKKNVKPKFDSVVEISKKEFDSLSEDSKVFGCMPSFDAHNSGTVDTITVDPKKDMHRTAGGHIHIGGLSDSISVTVKGGITDECKKCKFNSLGLGCEKPFNETFSLDMDLHKIDDETIKNAIKKIRPSIDFTDKTFNINLSSIDYALTHPLQTIPLIDLICGIPSILVDRDEYATTRRKAYGKAGNYRTPKHGLEYRTLSNFWIKSYPLMSLFTGLARTAILIIATDYDNGTTELENYMWKDIDKKDVVKAIHENNFELAREIFNKIYPRLIELQGREGNFPISESTIHGFMKMVVDGYKKFFKEDVIDEWINPTYPSLGWEKFATRISPTARDKDKVVADFNSMKG